MIWSMGLGLTPCTACQCWHWVCAACSVWAVLGIACSTWIWSVGYMCALPDRSCGLASVGTDSLALEPAHRNGLSWAPHTVHALSLPLYCMQHWVEPARYVQHKPWSKASAYCMQHIGWTWHQRCCMQHKGSFLIWPADQSSDPQPAHGAR